MKQTDHQMIAVYDYSHLPNIGQYNNKEMMVEGHVYSFTHTLWTNTRFIHVQIMKF